MDQGNEPRLTPYERWLKQEKVPVIMDYFVRDLTGLALEPWERKG
jgi:hypothetical protein